MGERSFYRYYSDVSTYSIPNLQFVEADTLKDAVRAFCKEHRLKFDSKEEDVMWFLLPDGAVAQYSVTESYS